MIVGRDSNVHHRLCDLPECFELNYGSSFFSKNQEYLLLHVLYGPTEGPKQQLVIREEDPFQLLAVGVKKNSGW